MDDEPTLDEFCLRYGIRLLPWQRELVERVLAGEQLVWRSGRSSGKYTLDRVASQFSYYLEGWQAGYAAGKGE